MFGWLRRSDGFEWHKYVRTTIKLRRDNRKARVRDAGRAVKHHGKAAGAAAIDLGGAAAVAVAAGARDAARVGAVAARAGAAAAASGAKIAAQKGAKAAVAGAHVAAKGASAAGRASVVGSDRLARWTGFGVLQALRALLSSIGPTWRILVHPRIGGPLGLVGLLALFAGVARILLYGFDIEAGFAFLIAAIALGTAHVPRLIARPEVPRTVILRRLSAVSEKAASERGQRVAGFAVLALAVIGIGWWLAGASASRPGMPRIALPGLPSLSLPSLSLPSLAKLNLWPFGSEAVNGRASVSGEDIVVGGKRLRLAGVEMPLADQRCRRPGGEVWSCGRSARAAMARAVSGRLLSCRLGGSATATVRFATCSSSGEDIAGALVKQGYVFASDGWFAEYRTQESEASAAKRGLWSGNAERPVAYRDRLWAEAARSAPNGCPIKGRVRSREKSYLMPWSPGYARERITPSRGERWFCSEAEASRAGFSPL